MNDLNIIMEKFNQLNEQYNTKNEILYKKIVNSQEKSILDLDDKKDVFEIIKKANNDINFIYENIDLLDKKLLEYNNYKKNCEESINLLQNFYSSVKNLSSIIENNHLVFNKLNININVNDHSIDQIKSSLESLLQEINENINNINIELNSHNKKIFSFKNLLLKCINYDNTKNYKNICTICLSNKINTCLNTCGHTFCSSCTEKMNNKCAICRKKIESKIKIFIDDNLNLNENNSDSESYFEEKQYNNNNDSDNETNDGISGFEGFNIDNIFRETNSVL